MWPRAGFSGVERGMQMQPRKRAMGWTAASVSLCNVDSYVAEILQGGRVLLGADEA